MMFLKKIFLFSLLLSLLISGIVRFSAGNTAFAGDPAQLITLKGESDMISPDSVKVKLGTTVVWYNSGPGPAKIVFITKIGLACSVPVNFYADLFGHYESTAIPVGGTASICFIGEGEYEYTVTRMISKGKDQPIEASAKGKIISVK